MWLWLPGTLSLLLLQSVFDMSLAAGRSTGGQWGCAQPSLNHQLWNNPAIRQLASFGSWPLGGSTTHPPSQIYRFLQDNLDLLTDQALTYHRALKPYYHLIDSSERMNDHNLLLYPGDKRRANLPAVNDGRNELNSHTSSEENELGGHDENDVIMYDHSHSLRDVQKLWENWQRNMDDFFGSDGLSEDVYYDGLVKQTEDELKEHESMLQEQVRKEEQLEIELERERVQRREMQSRIERQREELRKQIEREMEEKRALEQREAILEERRRQARLENMRLEQERLLKKQQQEDELLRRRQEEYDNLRNEKARRLSGMEGTDHFRKQQQNNVPVSDHHIRGRQYRNQRQKEHTGSRTEIYSTQIPNDYDPRDMTLRRVGSKVEIHGKHVCGCNENCVIKEFERSFTVPKDTLLHTLKADFHRDGTLSIAGRRGHPISQEWDSSDMRVPLEAIGFSNQDTETYKERLECLRKKAGIKIHKMDKRTGKTYSTEEFTDADSHFRRKYETELDDDGVTIEVIE